MGLTKVLLAPPPYSTTLRRHSLDATGRSSLHMWRPLCRRKCYTHKRTLKLHNCSYTHFRVFKLLEISTQYFKKKKKLFLWYDAALPTNHRVDCTLGAASFWGLNISEICGIVNWRVSRCGRPFGDLTCFSGSGCAGVNWLRVRTNFWLW